MKNLLMLIMLLAGLMTQPLFAGIQPHGATTIMADDSGDGTPPTEEEEPDCE